MLLFNFNLYELHFTRREKDIINELVKGNLNKEIANNLNISVNTVKKYIKNIYKKVGHSRRIDVVNFFLNQIAA
jgi:DNA-binding NarL/FixJ family response regulator